MPAKPHAHTLSTLSITYWPELVSASHGGIGGSVENVAVGAEVVRVGTEGVGGIAGGVENGGLGRTRVGKGGVDVADTVRTIVSRIEAGLWQVVGPEVVMEEQVVGPEVAKSLSIDVCIEKCNVIDATIA